MIRVSPDGHRLRALARGEPQPHPFHLRWFLPWLLGANPTGWIWTSRLAMAACSVLAGVYCHAWQAALIPITLSGLNLNLRLPVLVDLPAMTVALAAAVCAQHGWWPAAIALSLAAGMTKETAPVFASLWAWNPILLLGLAAPAVRLLWKPGIDQSEGPMADALTHPWRTSQDAHRGQWANPLLWLTPWGVLLIGVGHPTWQLALAALAAYGQCLFATDSVRLWIWCWPVVLARTFEVTPRRDWFLLAVVAVAVMPYGGNGI